ncbi:Shedu immune nuclease family protein [Propionibacterium acidifaciens]|nr:Shedu immune nuclease family protein [Propionibacterium acidifaciens]
MITFIDNEDEFLLRYSSEYYSIEWVDQQLRNDGEVVISRVFTVRIQDLRKSDDDPFEENRVFAIGDIKDGYRRVRSAVLGLDHDLLIAASMKLKRSYFITERNISVFKALDEVAGRQIIIGGARPDAIDEADFIHLVKEFPTSTELKYYTQARIERVLQTYLETRGQAEERLIQYMNRKEKRTRGYRSTDFTRLEATDELELEKFIYTRDRFNEMLKDADAYSETDWRRQVAKLFTLVFPRYISVLEEVNVKERYSTLGGLANRYIDMLLVDSNGSVDILEIKKPFSRCLVSKRTYRDNHVPVRELAGAIVQCEKYIFYLNKMGIKGEHDIKSRYKETLPDSIHIKITNPRAYILAGRDSNLSNGERFDFEFIRRGNKNIADIITYDDLLRRLNNIVNSIEKRLEKQGIKSLNE